MAVGAKDVLLSESATESLASLEHSRDSSALAVARRVRSLRPILLRDCQHGEVVRKNRIPRAIGEKYGLENLYVEDLPSFWRLLYTIVRIRGERYIAIVEIVDHKTYNKWFPGRG